MIDEQPDSIPITEEQGVAGDLIYGDQIVGDKVGGDKITVGDIGAGAQVIVTQIQQALSAVDEMEKSIQATERRLLSRRLFTLPDHERHVIPVDFRQIYKEASPK
jgi:hypothetical protein